MIRRWSHINNANSNFFNFCNFEKYHQINVFKNSINYKKFIFKYTKYKRKNISRIKHKSNLLIYTNVFKFWTADYFFTGRYVKSQILKKIFSSNFYFYNFSLIKNKNFAALSHNMGFIFSVLSKKTHNYFLKFTDKNYQYFKNNNIIFAWSPQHFNNNLKAVLIASEWHSNLYPLSQSNKNTTNIEILSILNLFINLNFTENFEFYKILMGLYFVKILTR